MKNYKRLVKEYSGKTPLIPQALFAMGRIYEDKKAYMDSTKDAELNSVQECYKELTVKYPDSDYAKYAENRLLFLKMRNLITE
jgi:outer membrane protein assembly factor BamD (BamD/ComL family)